MVRLEGAAAPHATREHDFTVVLTAEPATIEAILEVIALAPALVLVCVVSSMYGRPGSKAEGTTGQSVMPGLVGGLAPAEAQRLRAGVAFRATELPHTD